MRRIAPCVFVLSLVTAGCVGEIGGDVPGAPSPVPNDPQFFPENADDQSFYAQGATNYQAMCAGCHGQDGLGIGDFPSLAGDVDLGTLARTIHETMPLGNASACVDECAGSVAVYIYANVIGRRNYGEQCVTCHGPDGRGGGAFPAVTGIDDLGRLAEVIDTTMPIGDPASCQGDCAGSTAWYIHTQFVHDPGSTPGGEGPIYDCDTPGPRMLRRLSSLQYRNTLVALFGTEEVPREDVLTDPVVLGFRVDADEAVVRDLGGQQLMTYAEKVAQWAVTTRLSSIAPCRDHNESCQRRIIEELGLRAHREPLDAATVDAYRALFAAESSFEAGLEVVVATMLQSPFLLYRRELGAPGAGGEYQLSPYEIASSLSYLLVDGPPDAALLDAAANGRLASRADIDREAVRLLGTEAGRATLAHFVDGWLEIEGVLTKVKIDAINVSPEVRRAMLRESELLFADTFFEDGGIETLFTAPYTFVDRRLAEHYQMSGPGGDSHERVDIPEGVRSPGILGHGAFLTAHALSDLPSPVQRGFIVRERLLCQDLLPPPAGVDTNLEAPMGATTNRERYDMHRSNDQCRSCHTLMDPIGFTFEGFDAVGRRRLEDGGRAVDTSGLLNAVPEGEVELSGLEDLSSYLSESDAVSECLTRYWAYYAYGRANWERRGCTDGAILQDADGSGRTLRSVLMGIVHAPHFTRRLRDE